MNNPAAAIIAAIKLAAEMIVLTTSRANGLVSLLAKSWGNLQDNQNGKVIILQIALRF